MLATGFYLVYETTIKHLSIIHLHSHCRKIILPYMLTNSMKFKYLPGASLNNKLIWIYPCIRAIFPIQSACILWMLSNK